MDFFKIVFFLEKYQFSYDTKKKKKKEKRKMTIDVKIWIDTIPFHGRVITEA